MKWFSISFLAGIATQIFVLNCALYIAFLIAFACLCLNSRKKNLTIICFVGYGIFYASLHGYFINVQTVGNDHAEREATIKGIVNSIPVQGNFDQHRFIFEPIDSQHNLKRILVSWSKPNHEIRPGQEWELTLTLRPIHGYKNPHGFDYEHYLVSQKIGATAKVKTSSLNRLIDNHRFNIHRFRLLLKTHIYNANASDRTKGLLTAMLLGDRSGITQEDKELFQLSGISHLIAISGLHIGLVSSLLILLTLKIGRRFPRYWHRIPLPFIAALFALLGAAVYAMIAGFSLPTERALLLVVTATFALFLYQRWNSYHLLSMVCMQVLIINPYAIISVSFWLSFFAVFCILWLNQYTAGYQGWKKWAIIQTGLVMLMTPISCLYFGQASLIAPIANAIAIPVIGFVVIPLALTGLLICIIIPPLGIAFITAAAKVLSLLIWIVSRIPELLGFDTLQVAPSLFITAICTLALLALFTRGMPYKWLLASLLFIALLPQSSARPDNNSLVVHFFDVGQGLSIFVETPNYKLLYDTGPRHGLHSAMQSQILPYLKSRHIHTLDAVILSHDDGDHTGGLRALLESTISVNTFYSSTTLKDHRDINTTRCHSNTTWKRDHVHFLFLHPTKDFVSEDNDMSCVLSIYTQTHKILLPGDISKKIENRLIQMNEEEISNVDLLSIPHHGSNTSSSDEFVRISNSGYAVASTSRFNQWSFPKDKVVERYLNHGSNIEQTALSGMISFTFTEGVKPPKVQRYRDTQQKIW